MAMDAARSQTPGPRGVAVFAAPESHSGRSRRFRDELDLRRPGWASDLGMVQGGGRGAQASLGPLATDGRPRNFWGVVGRSWRSRNWAQVRHHGADGFGNFCGRSFQSPPKFVSGAVHCRKPPGLLCRVCRLNTCFFLPMNNPLKRSGLRRSRGGS